MNSPTHSLVALALLSRKGETRRNWAVFFGSLIPDLFIYVGWVWLTFVQGQDQAKIWNEIYFDQPMQTIASLFNSIPVYLAFLAIGIGFRQKVWGMVLMFFSLAALLHISMDFPVHAHDAYAHFWPISEWRFHSPLSYYETHLHGNWVGLFESFLCLVAIYVLWKRFPKLWVKILLGIFLVLTILMMTVRLRMLLG